MKRVLIGAIAVLVLLTLAGGALAMMQSRDDDNETGGPVKTTPLQIVQVEPQVLESFPPQLQVRVIGIIPDSCTEAREPQVTRAGTTFTITILGQRPEGVACAQVISQYEETIALGAVEPGEYTIQVNDAATMVTVS